MTQKTPRSAAQSILLYGWSSTVPVDLHEIARPLNITLREGNFPFCAAVRRENNQHHIDYDLNETPLRQRFALAHAIGHCVLGHDDCPPDRPDMFSKYVVDQHEREANDFALELLMPERIVRYLISVKNCTDFDKLAATFAVSQVAMALRLKKLTF